MKPMILATLLTLGAIPSLAAPAPVERRPDAAGAPPPATFEGDAEAARRKAAALAKSLKLSGRGAFLQGLGMQALLAGDYVGSKAAFQRMIDEDPNHDEGYLQLASAAEASGDPAEAARLYTRAMELRPDLAPYYRNKRGKVLFEAGRWDLALKDADAGLTASPKDPDLLRLRSKCLINLGDYAGAASSYDAAQTHGRRLRTGEDDWLCGRLLSQGFSAKGCRTTR